MAKGKIMEEKNTLAPWEELNQTHEQVSRPSETTHPAEQISQAHEGLKEIKEDERLQEINN